ncbi:MAG: ROK family protein [Phycisphaerales bacterium]
MRHRRRRRAHPERRALPRRLRLRRRDRPDPALPQRAAHLPPARRRLLAHRRHPAHRHAHRTEPPVDPARDLRPSRRRERAQRTPLRQIGSSVIAQAYDEGDKLTRDVIHESADLLGRAISNVVTLLALPDVILGGGLTEALGQPWVEHVAASCREHVFPKAAAQVRFGATTLEDRAGLLGAALLARERLPQLV